MICVCGHDKAHHGTGVGTDFGNFTRDGCKWNGCGCPYFVKKEAQHD